MLDLGEEQQTHKYIYEAQDGFLFTQIQIQLFGLFCLFFGKWFTLNTSVGRWRESVWTVQNQLHL